LLVSVFIISYSLLVMLVIIMN